MSAPSRVLMTADTIGGVWTFALELSRALADRGATVGLATLGAPPSPDQRDEAAAIAGLELYESDYKLEWMHDPWEHLKASGEWLLELEQRLAPEVVHLNTFAHGALPWTAPAVLTAHSCVWSWWYAVHHTHPPEQWHRYWSTVEAGLSGAVVVVTVSHFMAGELLRHYGRAGVRVVYNGLPDRDAAAGLKQPLVLAAGRVWDRAKNLQILGSLDCDWPLWIAGNPAHPDGGVAELPGCRLMGRLDRAAIRSCFESASIFVSPALYEPFGLSVLEAAQHGCALVLSDIDSFRELWDGAAVFVTPGDGEALGRAIRGLARDRRHRADLMERARKRAACYSTAQMLDGYLVAYRDAARHKCAVPAGLPCAS